MKADTIRVPDAGGALRSGASPRNAIRYELTKLAQRCVDLLTRRTASPLTDGAVHEIRTSIKRMRALLRLVRSDIGATRYEQAKRPLQAVTRSLASVRDAKVVLTACQRLLHRHPTDSALYSRRLRANLLATREKMSPRQRRAIAARLATVRKCVASWPESRAGWKVLSQGLRHEYAGARDSFESARLARKDARLHELRKRSKSLFYMCELLATLSPYAGRKARKLERFAACLGDFHDLSVLRRTLPSRRVQRLAHKKQVALRRSAGVLGARFFRHSTATFIRRTHREWQKRYRLRDDSFGRCVEIAAAHRYNIVPNL